MQTFQATRPLFHAEIYKLAQGGHSLRVHKHVGVNAHVRGAERVVDHRG